MNYFGYQNLIVNDNQLAAIYSNDFTKFEKATELDEIRALNLKENEYLIVKNKDNEVVDKFCYQNGLFRKVNYTTIRSEWNGNIKPLDDYQAIAFDMLNDRKSKVKIIRGVYGSGKDFIMVNKALQLIEKNKFKKIIYIRPNVTLANVPQIGFLPNGLEDKLGWTMGPLLDKVGEREGLDKLIEDNTIEMFPLLFIRGMSFNDSIVYVSEAQNIDSEIAKVLISRIGANSELWINGDNHQTDNRIYDQDNGVTKMIERLAGNSLFAYVYLPQSHRSDVANLANLLDD